MAPPTKKREIDDAVEDSDEETTSSDEDEEGMGNLQQGQEIQVDFEGRNPMPNDFPGIKMLLQQLFLKAHIDLQDLTEIITSQSYVGSVVKQYGDDSDDDDEALDYDAVFGITTVINVSSKKLEPCIVQLRELLQQLATEHATDDESRKIVKTVLDNDALGLLINERFVNIPAQISVPLLENLITEMDRACRRNLPFKFNYLILICKLYKLADSDKEVIWSNPEEEIIAEDAIGSVEFPIETESDSGLGGERRKDQMIPYRRILILEASKLRSTLDKIRANVS